MSSNAFYERLANNKLAGLGAVAIALVAGLAAIGNHGTVVAADPKASAQAATPQLAEMAGGAGFS